MLLVLYQKVLVVVCMDEQYNLKIVTVENHHPNLKSSIYRHFLLLNIHRKS